MSILAIARTESRRIFVSPLAWAVLAVLQFILALAFMQIVGLYLKNAQVGEQFSGVADYVGSGLYGFSTLLLLMTLPLMTMRLFAEERKSGSLTLLLASPVSLTGIVLGKFLGLVSFMLAVLILLFLMPASLEIGTHLDFGRLFAGLFGLLLLMMAFGAAGLFISTLTREPTIAAVTTFGVLLLIWLLQWLAEQSSGPLAPLFGYLSLIGHFESLRRGVFNSADVVYYVLFIALFLWLAVQRLDMERN
jgi:ABC-2 type transport system permease protein